MTAHRAQYYPAFIDIQGKRVLVVGGGHIALGKVEGLVHCGPEAVVVVAPEIGEPILRIAASHPEVQLHYREYQPGDVDGSILVFAATDDRPANQIVANHARAQGIPVLAVDDTDYCDFIAPAIVRRGDMVIAISTAGGSPAMARRAREKLDAMIPSYWGELLRVAATVRTRLGLARRAIPADHWQTSLDHVESLVAQGRHVEAEEELLNRLTVAEPARA